MRIAMVSAGYPPTLGGIERHVARLSRCLADAGHEVTVLTQDKGVGDSAIPEIASGIEIRRFSAVGPSDFATSIPLLRHLHKNRASWDLVHLHNYHRSYTGLALLFKTTPIVVTTHYHATGHTALARRLHTLYRPFGSWTLSRTAAVIAVSRAEQRLIQKDFGRVYDRTLVIPNGVDRPSGGTTTRATTAQPAPVILVTGRLERYKSVHRLIEALPYLDESARIVVCGEGPERDRLTSLVAQQGLEARVFFLGRVSEEELTHCLETCSAVVSLSAHEAFGLAVAEALANGVPVACSDIEAHLEFSSLVPDGALTFVSALAAAEETAGAVDAAMKFGRFDGGDVRLLTWPAVAEEVAQLYSRVLAVSRHTEHRRLGRRTRCPHWISGS